MILRSEPNHLTKALYFIDIFLNDCFRKHLGIIYYKVADLFGNRRLPVPGVLEIDYVPYL